MLGSLIDDFHEQKEHQVLVKSFYIFVSRYPKKAGETHALRTGQVRRKRQHKGIFTFSTVMLGFEKTPIVLVMLERENTHPPCLP